MPILLKFVPKTEDLVKEDCNQLVRAMLNSPFLCIRDANSDRGYMENLTVAFVELNIEGMYVSGDKNNQMLNQLIINRLRDLNLPFELSVIQAFEKEAGDYEFRYECFKPLPSSNSRLLQEIGFDESQIPDEYLCPITASIMDRPVHDVRAPNAKYDKESLMFWLNQNCPRRMPDTRLHFDESFLKVDFKLAAEIEKFINENLELAETKRLVKTLNKFKISDGSSKDNIEKALRRAAMNGEVSDIKVLLATGANVDARDSNPRKGLTAMHWALQSKKFNNVRFLMMVGAKLDIKDANGKTALTLISNQEPGVRENLLNFANVHGHDVSEANIAQEDAEELAEGFTSFLQNVGFFALLQQASNAVGENNSLSL